LNPSMRIKAKGDSFFLPDENGGVYFRNNMNSFRMEGDSIHLWIEKLMPKFNGEFTMEELTAGLSPLYRERVEEIVSVLLSNGYVRDISLDRPHELSDHTLRQYAAQIEFLDNMAGSGAARFQSCREADLLAVGSGSIFVSLVSSLLDSGIPRFKMLITDPEATNRERISELAAHARLSDQAVELIEVESPADCQWSMMSVSGWREVVKSVGTVLYVSQEGEHSLSELKALHTACRSEKKIFVPALVMQRGGMAGPLVTPDSPGCWESAWRRVHLSGLGAELGTTAVADTEAQTVSGLGAVHDSSTVGALLSNVIVFEWLKLQAGVAVSERTPNHQFFLIDAQTLEGQWHPFLPHPLAGEGMRNSTFPTVDVPADNSRASDPPDRLLTFFHELSIGSASVLHQWEEGDTKQLPLSQCRVQAADPLSAGPAKLLPAMVCAGMTHYEARREAGLSGIEAYAARLSAGVLEPGVTANLSHWGIGAGESQSEAIGRGLFKLLSARLAKDIEVEAPLLFPVKLKKIEDKRCAYYLRALTTLQGEPVIGFGDDCEGFQVVFVGTNGCWHGGIGLNRTAALSAALVQALQCAQNGLGWSGEQAIGKQLIVTESVRMADALAQAVTIPEWDRDGHGLALQHAVKVLKRRGIRLAAVDLSTESFMTEGLTGVFGVFLQKEEGN